MYAVAFDLTVVDTEKHHPKGVSQAYTEIGAILGEHGFRRVQGSLYVTDDEDMANLFLAIQTPARPRMVSKVGTRHPSLPCRAMVGLYCRRQRRGEPGLAEAARPLSVQKPFSPSAIFA
jgi:virulence-associated protein VapD